MGQQQSSEVPVCTRDCCAPQEGNTMPTTTVMTTPVEHKIRVQCLAATSEALHKLRAVLEATSNCHRDASARSLRQASLARLARTFVVPHDATVAQLKALVLTNGFGGSAEGSTVNIGAISLLALQRPLPERMLSVRAEASENSSADAITAVPDVSVNIELTDLVTLPDGLPLLELADCDQFLTDLDEDAAATDAPTGGEAVKPTLTFFFRDESIFGATATWTVCDLCRPCFCKACCCDDCCPHADVHEQDGNVNISVRYGPRARSSLRKQQQQQQRAAQPVAGAVLVNEVAAEQQHSDYYTPHGKHHVAEDVSAASSEGSAREPNPMYPPSRSNV